MKSRQTYSLGSKSSAASYSENGGIPQSLYKKNSNAESRIFAELRPGQGTIPVSMRH
jgi:hypothetical protein